MWHDKPAIQVTRGNREVQHRGFLSVDHVLNLLNCHAAVVDVTMETLTASLPLEEQIDKGPCPASLGHH